MKKKQTHTTHCSYLRIVPTLRPFVAIVKNVKLRLLLPPGYVTATTFWLTSKNLVVQEVQWESKYHTSQVFKWLKV